MSHNLNVRNGRAAMFYYGEAAWHKLGTEVSKAATAEEAIVAAQLDFTVEKFPLGAICKGGGLLDVPDNFGAVRTDTSVVLGVVGNRYEVLQNKDAFIFFDAIVGKGAAIYHTAGALGKGERIWILAKMPDYIKVGKDDAIEKYVLLCNSHNGKSQVIAKITPVRVVCENTLSMALSGVGDTVKIRHTKSVTTRLEEAHRLLDITHRVYAELEAIFNKMSLVKVTDRQLIDYVKKLVPDNEDADRVTRTENIRQEIVRLAFDGEGAKLPTAKGTLWGAYNAVTEFVDHVRGFNPAKNGSAVDRRLQSMWFGSGEELKEEAFALACQVAGIDTKINMSNN